MKPTPSVPLVRRSIASPVRLAATSGSSAPSVFSRMARARW